MGFSGLLPTQRHGTPGARTAAISSPLQFHWRSSHPVRLALGVSPPSGRKACTRDAPPPQRIKVSRSRGFIYHFFCTASVERRPDAMQGAGGTLRAPPFSAPPSAWVHPQRLVRTVHSHPPFIDVSRVPHSLGAPACSFSCPAPCIALVLPLPSLSLSSFFPPFPATRWRRLSSPPAPPAWAPAPPPPSGGRRVTVRPRRRPRRGAAPRRRPA